VQCSSCMGRLALTVSNHGEATGFDLAPKKLASREMGLDASRDEGTHPSGSHRTGQTLTRIIPSNFDGESCFAIFWMDSQCVKIGLTYQLHSFPSRASLAWKSIEDYWWVLSAGTNDDKTMNSRRYEQARCGRGERI
jgi:hypothetical protein